MTTEITIGKQVLESLGKPLNLLKVECREIGENCYRCNVWVRDDKLGNKVSDSFVVKIDVTTKAISPTITKKY